MQIRSFLFAMFAMFALLVGELATPPSTIAPALISHSAPNLPRARHRVRAHNATIFLTCLADGVAGQ